MYFNDVNKAVFSCFPQFPLGGSSALPDCGKLNQDFARYNNNSKPISFIEQDDVLPYPELSYEQRIYKHGLIATRKNNWHDFFNAMVWKTFPLTKSAINAIHYHEIALQQSPVRSRKRDVLTLFDESGIIIIAKQSILRLIKSHSWHKLFVENREQWLNQSIQIITFGHALYEKYLNPYIGMTAHALLLNSEVTNLDVFLSTRLNKNCLLNSKKELSPLPLLGIPLWHQNQDNKFYANKNYFR